MGCTPEKPKEEGTAEGQFKPTQCTYSTIMFGEKSDYPVSQAWYYHIARDGDSYVSGWYKEDEYATKVVKRVIINLCVINGFISCSFTKDVDAANTSLDYFFNAKPVSFDFLVLAEKYYAKISSDNKDYCNYSGRADQTFELFDIVEFAASFGTVTIFKKLARETGEEILEEVAEVSLKNWSKSALKEGNYIVYRAFKDGKLYIGKTVDEVAYRYTRDEIDNITAKVIIDGIPNNGTAKGVEQAIMELNGFVAGKANKSINPLSNVYNSTVKEMYKKAGVEWLTKNKPNWRVDYLFK